MRLRTKLALAFAALAVLPVLVSAPFVARRLRATFSRQLQHRGEAASGLAAAAVQRLRGQLTEAVAAAARDSGAEELARAVQGPGPLPPPDAVRSLSEGRGLSVLALVDAAGRVRNSAHFAARVGDVDPGLRAALDGGGQPVLAEVQAASPEGPRLWPALLAAQPVEGVPGTFVVGGVLLDGRLAAQLAAQSGAEVELRQGADVLGSGGHAEGRLLWTDVPLGSGAVARVGVGDAASAEAEAALLGALAAVVGAGLLLALALGVLLAGRTTQPLEALTRGARQVADGQLDARVEVRASGELGVLVDAFNQMTAALSRTTQALVKAERIAAWEEVARGLAHELKNPLTPLQMSLETLAAAQAEGSPRFAQLFRESAPAMREEVERLKRTVDAFARFARLPPSTPVPLDLGAWAEQALSLYRASGDVTRETSLAPGLVVLADRDQLAQLLHNLLKNAEEAMAGLPAWVAVRVRAEDSWALLEVEDAGPGVSAEEEAHIFEPAFSGKPGGMGLGLALARRIATEHRGTLQVARGSRGGARFQLRLPRLPD